MENKINYADLTMDDIIFIDRNQDYGAYKLRRDYNKNIRHAMLGTLCFLTLGLASQSLYSYLRPFIPEKIITVKATVSEVVKQVKMLTPPADKKPPEMPKGKPNVATATLAEMKAVKETNPVKDTISPIDPAIPISESANTGKAEGPLGIEKGEGFKETPKEVASAEPQTVSWAEDMPEFPGGENELIKFIRRNLEYPEYERQEGIQGKAVVGFVIDENGKVTNVSIKRGVSQGIDNEAKRVIKMLPRFKPGMQGGHKVRVNYVIPIDFHMTD